MSDNIKRYYEQMKLLGNSDYQSMVLKISTDAASQNYQDPHVWWQGQLQQKSPSSPIR